jgi:hypothetical protein
VCLQISKRTEHPSISKRSNITSKSWREHRHHHVQGSGWLLFGAKRRTWGTFITDPPSPAKIVVESHDTFGVSGLAADRSTGTGGDRPVMWSTSRAPCPGLSCERAIQSFSMFLLQNFKRMASRVRWG